MTTKTIKVKTDDSLIGKLKNAFTSPQCALSEAMQNARRANATKITFRMLADDTLSIEDDGDGITDLQDVITLAGSGWSDEVIEQEGAFGMGSFSMIYYCDQIAISSRGEKFECSTKDLLSGLDIPVINGKVTKGAVITMTGFCLSENNNAEDILNSLKGIAKGFSIPVFFIDEYQAEVEIERPHRLTKQFTCSSVGDVLLTQYDHVQNIGDDNDVYDSFRGGFGSNDSYLYYQGLPVGDNNLLSSPRENVVHLDEKLFSIRMPDRDVLISHQYQKGVIKKEIKALWQKLLVDIKKRVSADVFANKLYSTLKKWDSLSLLNDVKVLPSFVVFQVTEEPFQERSYYEENFETEISISKSELVQGQKKLLLLDSLSCNEESIIAWEYAYLGGFFCITSGLLDPGHWVNDDKYTTYLSEENQLTVSMKTLNETGLFSGDYCYFGTSLGDSVQIDGPLGRVETDRHCIYVSEESLEIIDDQSDGGGCGMFIPSGALSGSDINKACHFLGSGEDWDETAYDQEAALFGAYLLSVNESSSSAIMKLLNDGGIKMMNLKNTELSILFDSNGSVVEVKQAA